MNKIVVGLQFNNALSLIRFLNFRESIRNQSFIRSYKVLINYQEISRKLL